MKQQLHYFFLVAVLCCLTFGFLPQAKGQVGPYSNYFAGKNDRDTIDADGNSGCKNQMPDVLAYVVSQFSPGTNCTGSVTATITDSTGIPAVGTYLFAQNGTLTIPDIVVKDACGNFSSQRITIVVQSYNSRRPELKNVSIDVSCPGTLEITGDITNSGYQFDSKIKDSEPMFMYTYDDDKGKLEISYEQVSDNRLRLKCGTSYTTRIKLKNDRGCISDTVLQFTTHSTVSPVSSYFTNKNWCDTIDANGSSGCKNRMPDVLAYVAGKYSLDRSSEGYCTGSVTAFISDSTNIPAVGEYLWEDITIPNITVRDYCGTEAVEKITITVKRTNNKAPKLKNVSIDVSCPGTLEITGDITNNGYQFDSKIKDSEPMFMYTYDDDKGKLEISYEQVSDNRLRLKCGTSYTTRIKLKNDSGCLSDTVLHFTSHGGAKPVSSYFAAKNNRDTIDIGGSYLNCEVYMPDVLAYVAGKFGYPASMSGCSSKFTVSYPANATDIPAVGDRVRSDVTISGITVSDSCGNVSDQTVTIVVKVYKPEVTITANRSVLFYGDTVTLTTSVLPAAANYSFKYFSRPVVQSVPHPTPNERVFQYSGSEDLSFSITYTDQCGYSNTKSIMIHTQKVPSFSAIADTFCTPKTSLNKPFTPNTAANGSLTYTWTVKSNTGVTGANANSTPALFFFGSNLVNSGLAPATVVYEVTPYETYTNGGTYTGTPFEYSVTLKPSITNDGALTYDNADVVTTLHYGVNDTLLHITSPTISTAITEWQNSLTVTNNVSAANEGALLGRLTPGTHTITWTVTDPCGNAVRFDRNYIVQYPLCGEGYIVSDVDGNTYETVRIGSSCWTKSNLKTTKYSDGTAVPFATGYASLDYPDVDDNIDGFGRLYTWYSAVNVPEGDDSAVPATITDPMSGRVYVQGICPEGWALPSTQDLQAMTDLADNVSVLKSADQQKWLPGATGTDALGFTAVAGGYYDAVTARYLNLLGEAYFWTYDTHTATEASCLTVPYHCDQALYQDKVKGMGYSVRCVKRAND